MKTYSVAKRLDTRFLLDGEPAAIRCLRFSEDDRFLLALANLAAIDSLGEGYSEVAVWDASSHELLVCSRLVGAVHDARWNPRTSLEFATAGERGRLLFWTLESLTARSSARNGQLPESPEAPFNLMFSKPPPTAFDQSSLLARDAKSSGAPVIENAIHVLIILHYNSTIFQDIFKYYSKLGHKPEWRTRRFSLFDIFADSPAASRRNGLWFGVRFERSKRPVCCSLLTCRPYALSNR